MARTSNRGGSNRGGRNNNPSGRNQYSDWGVMELARERPVAAAAVAAGAAAAGLFLWSKRSQITDQLSSLSDQIGNWTDNMGSGTSDWTSDDDTSGLATSATNRSSGRGSSRGPRANSGENANLDASTGGGGTTSSASGRSRAQSTPTT